MMHFFKKGLPDSIWALSLSTFFLNLSSTIVFISMPLFFTLYFKIACSKTGALEGVAEGIALVTRAIIGMISDFSRKRKWFLVMGYMISFVSRFLLALGTHFSWVVASRFLDKVGNGFQASPREAYISDITSPALLGKAYGLNKALGMIGSLVASVLLMIVFSYFALNIRFLLYVATFLTALSIIFLIFGVRDVSHPCIEEASSSFWMRLQGIAKDICLFKKPFWISILVIFLFKLGYFSGTYLMLWLDMQGFETFFGFSLKGKMGMAASVVMILQNGFCALFSYPMGTLSDRIDRRYVVAIGIFCMLIALFCFGYGGQSRWLMMLGFVFYGIQMSMQGALMALLSSTMPKALKGTGFGIFFLVSGIGVIVANQLFMRELWERYSAQTAFLSIMLPIALSLCLLPTIPLKAER